MVASHIWIWCNAIMTSRCCWNHRLIGLFSLPLLCHRHHILCQAFFPDVFAFHFLCWCFVLVSPPPPTHTPLRMIALSLFLTFMTMCFSQVRRSLRTDQRTGQPLRQETRRHPPRGDDTALALPIPPSPPPPLPLAVPTSPLLSESPSPSPASALYWSPPTMEVRAIRLTMTPPIPHRHRHHCRRRSHVSTPLLRIANRRHRHHYPPPQTWWKSRRSTSQKRTQKAVIMLPLWMTLWVTMRRKVLDSVGNFQRRTLTCRWLICLRRPWRRRGSGMTP